MAENYEVIYTHPGGATATFLRHDGELDALAKALDAEQFWVFKNVKSLLARNEAGDLEEANRMMRSIGFTPLVREVAPRRAVAVAAPAPVAVAAHAEDEHAHGGIHLPGPSAWPLILSLSILVAFGGWMVFTYVSFVVIAIGLAMTLVSIIGWGLEEI